MTKLLTILVGIGVFTLADSGFSQSDLTEEEQQQLGKLNVEAAQEIATLAGEFEAWRGKLQQTNSAEEFFALSVEIVNRIETQPEEVRSLLVGWEEIREIVREANESWKNVQFDPEETLGLTEEEFRTSIREVVFTTAEPLLRAKVEVVLSWIEKLRDPAEYARDFLENEIEKKYFDKPYPIGDVRLTLKQDGIDRSKSLFAEDAGIVVVISYSDEIEVEAKGLYFEYRPGDIPKPNINKLTVDESALRDKYRNEALESLASALPLKVTDLEFLGFQPDGDNKRRGGIRFDVEAKFSEELPAIKGKDVVIYADGHVELGEIDFRNENFNWPIGTTGLGFQTMAISYATNADNDQPPTVSGTTKITTIAPGSSKLYALKMTVTVTLPVERIEMEGDLVLAEDNISIAWAHCALDFTDGSLSGEYKIPGKGNYPQIPIADVLASEGSFRLDGNGFVAKAKYLKLYGINVADAEIAILFNGHGYITAGNGFDVFGITVSSEVNAGYTPGFKDMWLEMVVSVNGVSLQPWGSLDVVVHVQTDNEDPGTLKVRAVAGSIAAETEVRSLESLTIELLQELLQGSAVAAYHEFLDNLARADEDGREWAAEQEKKTRKWLDENLGVTVKTNIPELDRIGERYTKGREKAGGIFADWRKKTGREVKNLSDNVQSGFKDPGQTVEDAVDRGEVSVGGTTIVSW